MSEKDTSLTSASFAKEDVEPATVKQDAKPLINLLAAMQQWLIHCLLSELKNLESPLRKVLHDTMAGQIESTIDNYIDWEDRVTGCLDYDDIVSNLNFSDISREIDVGELDIDDKVNDLILEFLHNV